MPLTKAVIKNGNTTSTVAAMGALESSASFKELAESETKLGHRMVAQTLVDGFALVSPNPSDDEIKVSLASSLAKLVEASRGAKDPVALLGELGGGGDKKGMLAKAMER